MHFIDGVVILHKHFRLLVGQCLTEFVPVSAHQREQVLIPLVRRRDRLVRIDVSVNRLEMMCRGTLEIAPRKGGGTSVKITIPKEESEK